MLRRTFRVAGAFVSPCLKKIRYVSEHILSLFFRTMLKLMKNYFPFASLNNIHASIPKDSPRRSGPYPQRNGRYVYAKCDRHWKPGSIIHTKFGMKLRNAPATPTSAPPAMSPEESSVPSLSSVSSGTRFVSPVPRSFGTSPTDKDRHGRKRRGK
jgi:hypothetical protein